MTVNGFGWQNTDSANSWPYVTRRLFEESFRLIWPGLFLIVAFACLGMLSRSVLPQTYRASAEIFIDPRGLQVFENELVNGQYDANAGVNYVESQMHVILSGQVLNRAMQYVEVGSNGGQVDTAALPEPRGLSSTELEALRRNISVSRAERSYIISVSARAHSPEGAARLANAVVQAYRNEDATSHTAIAARLTGNLESRLDQLRQRLAASEERAEAHRRQHNLVSTDQQLIVDQQLTAAVRARGEAEERLAAMRVRREQLIGAAPSTIMALADVNDQARLSTLLDRLNAAREEQASLSTRLGSMHPTLRSVQGQVAELEQRIGAEISRLRDASAILLRQAEQEFNSATAAVERLTEQSGQARASSIELRTLEEQIRSDRELLASFETRSREMSEFARIDSTNIRVLSMAYAPEEGPSLMGVILWGIAGAVVAGLIGFAVVVLRVMKDIVFGKQIDSSPGPSSLHSPRVITPQTISS
jgi:succinoglycan biosynthesis transport protein ExoP